MYFQKDCARNFNLNKKRKINKAIYLLVKLTKIDL
ncbi:hypothetical protein AF77_04840 [Aliarcobacter butzleri L352]|uniref:Uncharacterized protein n=1 Tax=Aliarcobacter butzleri L352 TaxID=1447260 RepID=A0A837JD98_9BACT|nr:hypothetical protein AF77_04840 [Aliarcobacter butzleri L352]